jgi:hypothetical protein
LTGERLERVMGVDVQRKKKRKVGSSIAEVKASDLEPSFEGTHTRIRNVLLEARHRALRAVDSEMVRAYRETGREIVEEEQRGTARAKYGAKIVQTLSKRLTDELGRGYTANNLWYMRQFYLTFPILQRSAWRIDLDPPLSAVERRA